jgi:DNA repair protein RadC
VFLALYLDAQHRLIEAEELFRGTLTQTSVYPREVVKGALARNAAALAVAHFVACHKMGVLCHGSFCSGTALVH